MSTHAKISSGRRPAQRIDRRRTALFFLLFSLCSGWGVTAAWGRDFPTGGTNPNGLALADFNNDDIPDVVVAHDDAPPALLLGDGQGGFGDPIPLDVPIAVGVAVGDFNQDGAVDVVATSSAGAEPGIYLLLGDGQGGFSKPRFFAVAGSPGRPVVADLNGDQYLDLVFKTGVRQLATFYGNGQGNFAPGASIEFPVCSPSPCLYETYSDPYLADFNNDGLYDIALLRAYGRRSGIFQFNFVNLILRFGDAEGTFSEGTEQGLPGDTGLIPLSPHLGLVAGDLNNDGYVDIIAQHQAGSMSSPSLLILLGDGTGGFPVMHASGPSVRGRRPILADWNNDGYLDMGQLIGPQGGSEYRIGLGDGTGEFTFTTRALEGTYTDLESADVNNDGYADLLLVRPATNALTLTVLLGDGSGEFR